MREAYATYMDILRAQLGTSAPVSAATVAQKVQASNDNVHGRINLMQMLQIAALIVLLLVSWGMWRLERHAHAQLELLHRLSEK